ncbi:MAG: phosphoribosylformylglycinamidine synthase [Lachnospiraceae bacterium]|nr:phosphoribosylformylglycinamidine synthase [Lachnospiraceae bacterium]
MESVKRVYVEKKGPYSASAAKLKDDLDGYLGISGVSAVRVFITYDVENISKEVFDKALGLVFSEPPVDDYYLDELPDDAKGRTFCVQYLPGQFDQRADSAIQCIRFLKEDEDPVILTSTTYLIEGDISDDDFERIKAYCINPVDSREIPLAKPETLLVKYDEPDDVIVFDGFKDLPEEELRKLYQSLSLAMTFKDFEHIQNYFKNEENRDPSMTEIRVLDTYWSDHCRHTTFQTELKNIEFEDGYYRTPLETTFESYKDTREEMFEGRDDKYICLMDLALMGMRKLKSAGKLEDMEPSDEINACSVIVPVEMDYGDGPVTEEWLVFFKNETHNHPTEIEPFGGAATCLGGAIRDPLSGRGYVYQAMRVTGAADPTVPVAETLKGKLPQKKLVLGAAAGYSSYGNQIGLATGYVKEIYHPDYVAKRMEIGAVMGAAPRSSVKRLTSDPGDVIILLGGRTGRDGCGGATGSSKAHTEKSIDVCGAEVQKGNAPTERKIQRLFRRAEVSRLIKKCNDFGAGGVSVAIGELADGLTVDLDLVPKKYSGLDGTELAISESQERMAVVVSPEDVSEFLKYTEEENLEATVVAHVTEEKRLVLKWRGKDIVNLSRAFLDTNGAHQETDVFVEIPKEEDNYFNKFALTGIEEKIENDDFTGAFEETLKDLNVCSQKGLVEMFDSSIGAGTVLMPYGGKYQLGEIQTMVAKLPVLSGKTDTVTMMSYGFDPYLSKWSPYHGAVYAVTQSMAKVVAAGGDHKKIRFTFQEYFRRMSHEPSRWSQPFAALLGAYDAQVGFGLPSIGGKDSMSGTFNDIDVPPTLVSFAVDVANGSDVVSPELKNENDVILRFGFDRDEFDIPVYENASRTFSFIHRLITEKRLKAAYAVDSYGIAAACAKMAFGNKLGVKFDDDLKLEELFNNALGDILIEVEPLTVEYIDSLLKENEDLEDIGYTKIGRVTQSGFTFKEKTLDTEKALSDWKAPLEKVFRTKSDKRTDAVDIPSYDTKDIYVCKNKVARPNVFIPVFPGTNCEYDSMKAFVRAGADVVTGVFRNLSSQNITDSVKEYVKEIDRSQIMMFPGGFSAGDEPDGSAKFFATAFRNEYLKDAVMRLLNERDGLVLGICNGFQALIKLGLVPNGDITGQNDKSPTLTFNTISRHISKMAYTKVVSNKSPWLLNADLNGVYTAPASHGEGRFVAPDEWIKKLFENGQVATVYCDTEGYVSMDEEWNINGSYCAIEGITSPDGRVFGKMAHAERRDDGVAINIYGNQDLKLFESGVEYFR